MVNSRVTASRTEYPYGWLHDRARPRRPRSRRRRCRRRLPRPGPASGRVDLDGRARRRRGARGSRRGPAAARGPAARAAVVHGARGLAQHGARGDEPARGRAGADAGAAPRRVRGAPGPGGGPRRLPRPPAHRARGASGRARRPTQRGSRRCAAAVDEGHRAAADGRWDDLASANQHFHRALVALGGSPRLDQQMALLLAEMRLVFHRMPGCASSTSPTSRTTPASASCSRRGARGRGGGGRRVPARGRGAPPARLPGLSDAARSTASRAAVHSVAIAALAHRSTSLARCARPRVADRRPPVSRCCAAPRRCRSPSAAAPG